MLIEIVGILFDLKIQVLSFSSTKDACDKACNDAGGKLPYLHQVRDDSNQRSCRNRFHFYIESNLSKVHEIHSKMYKGDKLNTNIFPVFTTEHSQGNAWA